CQQHDNYPWTF
nr:immunoglobulin light chain junction region [Macaca mulatta]